MAWTFCTSGAAIAKAGLNANSLVVADGTKLAEWSDEVEGTINAITRKDWISSLPSANFLGILEDTASDMIATKIINYSIADYTSKAEAQTMLNVLDRNMTRNLEVLKDQNNSKIW